jgi:hypothetical protein
LISLTIGAGQERKKNKMKKQRFHSHNAYILELSNYVDILISYYTPIGARVGGKFMTSNRKYSSSTTRQTNRYVKENHLDVEVMDDASFLAMMKTYAIANNFDLGRLR